MRERRENDVLVSLLSDSLKANNDTNRDGFDRLESASVAVTQAVLDTSAAAQRDFRVLSAVLLLGLLVAMGMNVSGSWGDASFNVTPAAQAATPEVRNGNP